MFKRKKVEPKPINESLLRLHICSAPKPYYSDRTPFWMFVQINNEKGWENWGSFASRQNWVNTPSSSGEGISEDRLRERGCHLMVSIRKYMQNPQYAPRIKQEYVTEEECCA